MDVDGVVPCIESIEHGIQASGGGDRRHQRRVQSSEVHSQPVMMTIHATAWWLIPLSKWVITPVINGITRVNPLITGL